MCHWHKNCSYECAYNWVELCYTIQHRTVLVIFPSILQIITITWIFSLQIQHIRQPGITWHRGKKLRNPKASRRLRKASRRLRTHSTKTVPIVLSRQRAYTPALQLGAINDYTSPAPSAVCLRNPLFTWITTHLSTTEGWKAELAESDVSSEFKTRLQSLLIQLLTVLTSMWFINLTSKICEISTSIPNLCCTNNNKDCLKIYGSCSHTGGQRCYINTYIRNCSALYPRPPLLVAARDNNCNHHPTV